MGILNISLRSQDFKVREDWGEDMRGIGRSRLIYPGQLNLQTLNVYLPVSLCICLSTHLSTVTYLLFTYSVFLYQIY